MACSIDVKADVARNMTRTIDLDIDIGADAVDYKYVPCSSSLVFVHSPTSSSAIANQESLSGIETEMRKLEGIVKEVVDELDYLKKREERFANTNRTSASLHIRPIVHASLWPVSTNQRVQNFAWFTLLSLVGLGIWQIFHLRAFFKRKYLID